MEAYQKINFEDSPSSTTPLNAANLNHMDDGIAAATDGVTALESSKLSAAPGAVDTENLADESITVEKVADDLAAVINAKEVKSNKKTTLTGNESSNDFYPTTKAVADALSSYSEIATEIVAARGDYDNLAQALSHLMGFLSSEIVNNATDTGKIYYTTTKKALIIPMQKPSKRN